MFLEHSHLKDFSTVAWHRQLFHKIKLVLIHGDQIKKMQMRNNLLEILVLENYQLNLFKRDWTHFLLQQGISFIQQLK